MKKGGRGICMKKNIIVKILLFLLFFGNILQSEQKPIKNFWKNYFFIGSSVIGIAGLVYLFKSKLISTLKQWWSSDNQKNKKIKYSHGGSDLQYNMRFAQNSFAQNSKISIPAVSSNEMQTLKNKDIKRCFFNITIDNLDIAKTLNYSYFEIIPSIINALKGGPDEIKITVENSKFPKVLSLQSRKNKFLEHIFPIMLTLFYNIKKDTTCLVTVNDTCFYEDDEKRINDAVSFGYKKKGKQKDFIFYSNKMNRENNDWQQISNIFNELIENIFLTQMALFINEITPEEKNKYSMNIHFTDFVNDDFKFDFENININTLFPVSKLLYTITENKNFLDLIIKKNITMIISKKIGTSNEYLDTKTERIKHAVLLFLIEEKLKNLLKGVTSTDSQKINKFINDFIELVKEKNRDSLLFLNQDNKLAIYDSGQEKLFEEYIINNIIKDDVILLSLYKENKEKLTDLISFLTLFCSETYLEANKFLML